MQPEGDSPFRIKKSGSDNSKNKERKNDEQVAYDKLEKLKNQEQIANQVEKRWERTTADRGAK